MLNRARSFLALTAVIAVLLGCPLPPELVTCEEVNACETTEPAATGSLLGTRPRPPQPTGAHGGAVPRPSTPTLTARARTWCWSPRRGGPDDARHPQDPQVL